MTSFTNKRHYEKFGIIVLLVLLGILSLYVVILLILPLIALGKPPIVNATRLNMIGFNLTENRLVANWDAQFILFDPNVVLSLKIKKVEGTLYYKNEEALSATSIDKPMYLDSEDRSMVVDLHYRSNAEDVKQQAIREGVLNEMRSDLVKGVGVFSLKIEASARYMYFPLFWYSLISIHCQDLEIQFDPIHLSGKMPRKGDCSVTRKYMFRQA